MILGSCIVLTSVIVWPMPLYGTSYVFSRNFFTFWIVIIFLWVWLAGLFIIIFPIWESSNSFVTIYKKVTGSYVAPISTPGLEPVVENSYNEKAPHKTVNGEVDGEDSI